MKNCLFTLFNGRGALLLRLLDDCVDVVLGRHGVLRAGKVALRLILRAVLECSLVVAHISTASVHSLTALTFSQIETPAGGFMACQLRVVIFLANVIHRQTFLFAVVG